MKYTKWLPLLFIIAISFLCRIPLADYFVSKGLPRNETQFITIIAVSCYALGYFGRWLELKNNKMK